MEQAILENLKNPLELEKLYRGSKSTFKREFNKLYPTIKGSELVEGWNQRLNYEGSEISWGAKNELLLVVVLSLMAGLIAKIPAFFGVQEDLFYQRNISFIVLPFLASYFIWKQRLVAKQLVAVGFLFISSILYVNMLPHSYTSDTLVLACIHLPLFLWTVLGYVFTGGAYNSLSKRLDFIKYNGDLLVMSAVTAIAGGLFVGISIGLFGLIGLNIEQLYFKYVVVFGAAAIPIVGTYLVRVNPQLVGKVSPVIAKVFTPLVLVTLVIYLVAILGTGKNPYTDRDFLIVFNLLLVGVMAIVFFSVAETSSDARGKLGTLMLFALTVATAIVNCIALSAILFRISEWGITPNRLAVLGSNLIMLVNLGVVSYKLYQATTRRVEMEAVEGAIVAFLPYYSLWTFIVAFAFPAIFQFK